jgi:hypothetical protein
LPALALGAVLAAEEFLREKIGCSSFARNVESKSSGAVSRHEEDARNPVRQPKERRNPQISQMNAD